MGKVNVVVVCGKDVWGKVKVGKVPVGKVVNGGTNVVEDMTEVVENGVSVVVMHMVVVPTLSCS